MAIRAATSFISKVFSGMSYSASTTGKEPKVAVSTASTPASKNSVCSSAIRSGRVRTRCSLQPSRRRTSEVVGSEVVLLHPGAEGPVEDEDAIVEGGEEV